VGVPYHSYLGPSRMKSRKKGSWVTGFVYSGNAENEESGDWDRAY